MNKTYPYRPCMVYVHLHLVSFAWFLWFTCRQIYTIPMVSQVLYWFVGLISPQVWSPSERLFSFSCRGWTLWHRTTNTKRFFASNIIWGRMFFFFFGWVSKSFQLGERRHWSCGGVYEKFLVSKTSEWGLCEVNGFFLKSMLGGVSILFC